jgi:predicted TPR repeat methyltransferase
MSRTASDTSIDSALALHRAGDFAAAEAAYRRLLDTEPAQAGRLLGVLLLQQRRHAEAATLLAPLSAAARRDVELAVNASLALRGCGRGEEALVAARRAAAVEPARLSVCNALGLAALERGALDEALEAFERGLRAQPGHPALRLHRAQCLRRLDRMQEAGDAFAALVQDDPRLIEAWRGLAQVQAAVGDAEAALASRSQALALAPRDPELAMEQAVALLQAGQAEAAAEAFKQLAAAAPEDAQILAWLGRAELKCGRLDAARAAFDAAQARAPEDPVVAHFRAALSGELPTEVEADYIRRLFDDFADRFERTLVGRLGYAPRALAEFLRTQAGEDHAEVLDLGCGTGLMAAELVREGRVIDGVDLSLRMLAHARGKGLYRSLQAAEALAFLQGASQRWDLIVAADVFVYIAELAALFAAAFERLKAAGVFAFSIELSDSEATELPADTGRYRHAPTQLRGQLAACGFIDIVEQRVDLRLQNDAPVAGVLMLAKRPG